GAGDVPLVVQPVQPFRVLRVSLRGCGRLLPRSAPSACSRTSPWSHVKQNTRDYFFSPKLV
ncbi:hypothetical protein PIB30_055043, partial [Stylosanthes scabra]|nr:hypothetical protein [Stylosanthes scabra]